MIYLASALLYVDDRHTAQRAAISRLAASFGIEGRRVQRDGGLARVFADSNDPRLKLAQIGIVPIEALGWHRGLHFRLAREQAAVDGQRLAGHAVGAAERDDLGSQVFQG